MEVKDLKMENRQQRFQIKQLKDDTKVQKKLQLRKTEKDRAFMKKREKIFKSSLEIVESNFDEITPQMKEHLYSLNIVISHFKLA